MKAVFLFFLCAGAVYSSSLMTPLLPRISREEYLRGGFRTGLFLSFSTLAYARREIYHDYYDEIAALKSKYREIPHTDTAARLFTSNDILLTEYARGREKNSYYTYSAWAGNTAVWYITDALASRRHKERTTPPDPSIAARRAALPFLGLGQEYTRKPYKAGFVRTTQIGCALSALYLTNTMNSARKKHEELQNREDYNSLSDTQKRTISGEWEQRYDRAQRDRTVFLWYGIVSYMYGILDAYIDAHLYNFDRRFSLLTQAGTRAAQLELTLTF
ncbi:MAG: DUF5683 domain-containing protein [Fibrobacterota bacterium]